MKEFRAVFGEELELRVGVDCEFLRNFYPLSMKEFRAVFGEELELFTLSA